MSSYEHLLSFVRFILPEEVVDNFDIVGVEEKSGVLHIRLDEQAIFPSDHTSDSLLTNGFFPSSRVYDFPICNSKVVLHIRRRRWIEKDTDKSYSRLWDITA